MRANIPKNMGGGPSNMQGLMRQAQKMQEEMQQKQAELEEKEYEVKAGGGAVTLRINGKKEVVGLSVSPELVDPDDTETLCDVIIAAVNEGIKTVETTYSEEMEKITGKTGLGIPGLF